MLVYWGVIEGCLLPLPTPRPTVLGVSVLDDEGNRLPIPQDVNGVPIYTPEQYDQLVLQEEVRFQVHEIDSRAAEFRDFQGRSAIETTNQAKLDDLDFQAKARLAEIDQGVFGTPEERTAQREEVNRNFEDAKRFIEEEGREENRTLETILNLATRLTQVREELDTDVRDINGALGNVDDFLGRALEALDLQGAGRAARAQEELTGRLRTVEENQLKLDILSTLARSPELIFFMGQQGTLGIFEGLLGDGDQTLSIMADRLAERPTTNIQEFMRLTGEEQGQERFRFSALTGTSDVDQTLLDQAPGQLGSGTVRRRIGR